MLLIAVSYRGCGRNLLAKLDTVINSLSAKYACLKTLYMKDAFLGGRQSANLMFFVIRCLQNVTV